MKKRFCRIFGLGAIIFLFVYFFAPETSLFTTTYHNSLQASASSASSSGLIDYWALDDASGTTAIDSAGSNIGTLNNATWNIGKDNGGLQLNGTNGYVSVPENASLQFGTGSFSVGTWFKTNGTSFGHLISNKNNNNSPGWRLVIFNSGQLQVRVGDGSLQAVSNQSVALNDGAWHYALFVVDRSANLLHLYVDGSEVGTAVSMSSVGSVSDPSAKLTFGSMYGGGTPFQFFNGTLDEVRIYNRALSLVEINQAMNDSGLPPVSTPPVSSPSDTTPPSISSIASSSLTDTSATISWMTDEPSDTQVEYGQTSAYGSSSPLSAPLVSSHTFSLSGLTASTTYHFHVISHDASGNVAVSGDQMFSTIVTPVIAPAIPPTPLTAPISPNPTSDPIGPTATLATFNISEKFGVNHPDQIIDFDYSGPYYSNMYMQDGSTEIPFQKLSNGKIAVRTSLSANSSKTFILKSGKTSSATYADQVSLSQSGNYYEIKNGLTGVRVLKGAGLPASQLAWAPIQGIAMKDGSWSPSGNTIVSVGGDLGRGGPLVADSISTAILENGPLKTVIKVTYAYTVSQPIVYAGVVLHSAGPGYYTSTITLEAGQPSILLEEDTDMGLDYKVNIYPQVQPDQGQYVAHNADDPAYGYEPGSPGVTCTGYASGTFHECFRDFDYSTPITSGYKATANTIPYMPNWSPWSIDTGSYWMLYNKNAAGSSPVVGAFVNQASRAIGNNATGYNPYFLPNGGNKAAGLEFSTGRRGPDGSVFPRSRYSWGIFVGTKADDLPAPTVIPTINKQMNLHGGFNLNKIYRYQLTFNDPSGGYGRLFNDPSMIQNIISKLRAGGVLAKNYHDYLYNAESSPVGRALIDLWSDPTGAKTHAAVLTANALSASMLNAFINGVGVLDRNYSYWQGGLAVSNELPFMDSILADPTLSLEDKAAVKADASLYSYILYDDDGVPLDTFSGGGSGNGLNAGTANMPIQMEGYRSEYTLFMPQHPLLQAFVNAVTSNIDPSFQSQVSVSGASACSPHYTGACVEPTLDSMLQAIMAGTNYFASDSRFTRFAEFLMQLSTPPEIRFKNTANTFNTVVIPRKMVEEGDGATEGTELTGIVAQGLRSVNPSLSARLMGAWAAGGKTHSGFFTTTLSIINENLPQQDPQLGSDNFPGYMSILRNGWNTAQEDALFLFNGDFLSTTGHRHDDKGNVVLYALKAPLTVNWSSFYTPDTKGGNMSSIVMPDTNFGGPGWNGDNQTLGTSSGWKSSTNDTFESFQNSSMSNAKMVNQNGLNWERKLYSITPDSNMPIIMMKDNFSGNTSGGKVMTLNLMAQGSVVTPSGTITPTVRLNPTATDPATVLPSTSPNIPLPAGINQFKFSGQTWNQHPTGGIDWDLYTVADEAQQAVIGNWGHVSNPSNEASQYRNANGVAFSESQDILRVHGNNAFFTLILPYNKGARPSDLSVTQDPTTKDIVIKYANKVIRANEHYYSYADNSKVILTSFDATPVSGNGITISGGPMEIMLLASGVNISISGSGGQRMFTLPGVFSATSGVIKNGSTYSYNYGGGSAIALSMKGTVSIPLDQLPLVPDSLIPPDKKPDDTTDPTLKSDDTDQIDPTKTQDDSQKQPTDTTLSTTVAKNLATLDFTQSIKLGNPNPVTNVLILQKALNAILNANLKEDGKFGKQTIGATKQFQVQHGLTADGAVGKNTRQVINATILNSSLSVVSSTPLIQPSASTTTTKSIPQSIIRSTDDTKRIQIILNSVVTPVIPVDGIMSQKTINSLKQFQRINNLTPDGVVGPKTRAKLASINVNRN